MHFNINTGRIISNKMCIELDSFSHSARRGKFTESDCCNVLFSGY